jgi:hypothetical protein
MDALPDFASSIALLADTRGPNCLATESSSLARLAGILPLEALFCPPLESQPNDVAELNDPGYDVSRHGELVIENGALIHGFLWVVPVG